MPLPPRLPRSRLFSLDARSEADVLREGASLSDDFERYFSEAAGRAVLVPGPTGRIGIGQSGGGGRPAYVAPVDGLVPLDEWTLAFALRRTGPVRARTTLVHAARALWIWLEPDDRITVRWAPADVTVTAAAAVGEEWATVRVAWDGATLLVEADGAPGAAATGRLPAGALPVSWCDGGLLVLDGAVDVPAVELADLTIDRYGPRPATGSAAARPGPSLRVDASAPGADFPPHLAGALALYTGFRLFEDGVDPDVGTSVRDQQFDLCTAAGLPLVRFGGLVSATRVGPDGSPDFSVVHDKLDRLHAGGADFHVTVDFNSPVTGLVEGDWSTSRVPPDDPVRYAEFASEVVRHLRDRYRVASLAIWNEPDIEDYWSGTPEEFLALWEAVHRRLLDDHPDLVAGTGDFAMPASTAANVRYAAERGLPLGAAHFHTYHQEFHGLREELRDLRRTMDDVGYGDVPIRITEWSMSIMRQRSIYTGTTSVNRAWGNRFRGIHAGAFVVAFLAEVLAEDPTIDMTTFSCIGAVDAGILSVPNLFIADETMLSETDPPEAFPSFAVMSLVWKLGGSWLPVSSNWPGLHALATRDGDTTTVVYGSWRPWRGDLDRIDVDVTVDGLPPRFTWTQWAVDVAHPGDTAGAEVVARGTEADLPATVRVGAVGAGALRVEPR